MSKTILHPDKNTKDLNGTGPDEERGQRLHA